MAYVLAALGGALGALARWGVATALPRSPAGWPWATLLVNLTGCLLLGVLLAVLAGRSPEPAWARPFLAVGALEEQFYAALLDGLGLADDASLPDRNDPRQWPALRERFTAAFASRPREQWWAVFAGTDACVAPVWSLLEATRDHHNRERGVFVEVDGVVQPDVAPRFSATPGAVGSVPTPGQHSDEIRAELGL